MIQKFQLGGQQDAIMQFVQGLALILLADPQQIVLAAQQNPKALEAAVQTYLLTQDMNQAAQVFTQAMLQQVQAARHGAKLQYLRSLKNQCPEGEELYYYKKGGLVGCGCKKKEDGGEIKKALNGAVAKFKNRTKAQLDKINKLSEEDYFNGTADHTKPGTPQKPVLKFKTRSKAELERINKLSEKDYFAGTADHTKPGVKKVSKKACGSKIKKDCNGAVAKFKAACGSKIKKNKLGGSLNGIFFLDLNVDTRSDTTRKGYSEKQIPYGASQWAGNNPFMEIASIINDKTTVFNNPGLQTGTVPTVGITKAKNAWEALQMVKAMKAEKAAKTAKAVIKSPKPKSIATGPKTVKLGNGYSALIEVPLLDNYQELFDAYKMTRASRLNINNILDKLPAEERANVLKVMMSNPDKYLGRWIGNITPTRAASSITNIRRRLPGEYTPLRVKSLDLTRPNMGTGLFLKFDNATSKTAGFKRTTGSY